MTKLTLDPNEENELGFSLSIKGKTSDSEATKPDIRFIVRESSTSQAVMFDNIKHENDMAKVMLPARHDMFKEGREYKGSLEVILGKHYFVAATVGLDFVEPLKVEAAIILKNSNGESLLKESTPEPKDDEGWAIESEIESVIIKPKKKPVVAEAPKRKPVAPVVVPLAKPQQPKQAPVSYKSMTDKEKKVVNTIFVAECKKAGIDRPQKHLKEGTEHTKKVLHKLLVKATRRVAAHRRKD